MDTSPWLTEDIRAHHSQRCAAIFEDLSDQCRKKEARCHTGLKGLYTFSILVWQSLRYRSLTNSKRGTLNGAEGQKLTVRTLLY